MAQSTLAPPLENKASAQPEPRRHRPLLLVLALLFAASMITYSGVWMYYVRWEPKAEIGVDTKDTFLVNGTFKIINIYPGSPAERAGIHVGDEIVAIDGRQLAQEGHNFFQATWLHHHPGDRVALTLRRPGVAEPLNMIVEFRAVAGESTLKSAADQVVGSYPLIFLIVGLVVLFLRLEDRNAWLLAVLLAGFISVSDLPDSIATADSPLRGFIYAWRAIFLGLLPFAFYLFFAMFPRRSALDRRLPWLKWIIGFIAISVAVPGIPFGRVQPWSKLSDLVGVKTAQYGTLVYIYSTIVLTLASLCWSAARSTDTEARRKLRVIFWGTVIGVFPATVVRIVSDFGHVHVPFWINFIVVILVSLFPLSFAYAVVKYRVMEVPVLLKQSARYVLVRRGFAVLIVLLALSVNVMLGIGFSRLFHLHPALAMSLGGTFGIALAWVSAPRVRRTAEGIDRAFFRSAYDARIVLQDLAQRVTSATSKEELAPLIQTEVERALHPASVAFYLRDGATGAVLRPVRESSSLPCLSGFANCLSQLREPVDSSEFGDLNSCAPELRQLQPECLVPVLSRSQELLGLIVLGAKRSEEPYTRENKQLLAAVAGQTGLVLESIELAEKMAERMEADLRAQQELQIARAVQSKLLPQQSPSLATLDYAGECIQARAVGGDYFDFLDLGQGKVAFVLADIAGKGISGALLMANLQASLRSLSSLAERDLPQFLQSVNRLFVRNTETSHYATVFFALYDDAHRSLLYANCGHNPPILLRSSGAVERLNATAIVLGLFEPWECSVSEIQINPGDVLVIFTDGITEAADVRGEEFGEERLIALLRDRQDAGAPALLRSILKAVQDFSPGEQADDLTAIVAICR